MSEDNKQTNVIEKDPVQDMLESLKQNQKVIFGIVGSLLVAFGAYTGVRSYQNLQEMEAQASLFKIEKKIEKIEESLQKENKKKADLKFEESYGPLVSDLETFIKANPNKKASLRAAMQAADIYSDYGMTEKALTALSLVQTEFKADTLAVLFHTNKMSRLIDGNKFDEAIQIADKILAISELEFTHAVAKLKKAVAVEAKGEKEEARALYKQISEDYPEHPAGKAAQQFLRIAN